MQAKVLVVGSLNMDLVVRAPHMPIPGETVIGSDFRTIPGGKGANQAVAAARLGAEVTMIGRVGDDDFGRAQLRNLGELGIDTTYMIVDPEAATGIALITLDASGQNSIVLAPGANMRLTKEDINAARGAIVQSDVLVLQLESPLEVVMYAIDIAHAEEVKVILNPAPARSIPKETLARLDCLIPNESETALLTGIEVADINSARAAAAEPAASCNRGLRHHWRRVASAALRATCSRESVAASRCLARSSSACFTDCSRLFMTCVP